MRLRTIIILAVASVPLLVRADDVPTPPAAAAATHTIHGKVRFAGTPPVPEAIHVHHDTHVCGQGGALVDESLLVDANGGLANTIVVIQGVTPELVASGPRPTTPPTLDQRNCAFVPHAQSVTQGTELAIQSKDPLLHNIHAFLGKRTVFNLAIPVANKVVQRRLDEPGIIRIRCDSGHTWMSAYIAVVPHQFHATSSRDGSFQIAGLPPGSYTLRAWHERLGAVEQRIEVTTADAQVSLTFQPPQDSPSGKVAPPPAEPTFGDALVATRSAVQQVDERQRMEQRARYSSEGRQLFHKFCATCHGDHATGTGTSARFTNTPPRDLTRGTFKFRMTPAGSPPSEADLNRTISVGVRGTHMPSWRGVLTRAQITTLARYVMSLSDAFWTQTPLPPPLDIPTETPYDASSVARGKALFTKMSCVTCHGLEGRGNGPAAAALVDDWSHSIKPPDFTTGALKGGCCGAAVYRAVSTGLAGTPMPAFGGAMTPAELWDVAHYVMSLGRRRPAVDYLLAPAGRITPP